MCYFLFIFYSPSRDDQSCTNHTLLLLQDVRDVPVGGCQFRGCDVVCSAPCTHRSGELNYNIHFL